VAKGSFGDPGNGCEPNGFHGSVGNHPVNQTHDPLPRAESLASIGVVTQAFRLPPLAVGTNPTAPA
jgi:hypothetical protein